MQATEVAKAVRRAVQFTVANKISTFLALRVPYLAERTALAVGASVLLVGLKRETRANLPSANLAAELALVVASGTLMQGVAVHGDNSLPLTLAHMCVVLEAGSALSPLILGSLGDSFLGQIQYQFATSIAALLVTSFPMAVAMCIAAGLAAASAWGSSLDSTLSTALSQSAFGVFKTLLLSSIPAGLQLQTITILLVFTRPLYAFLGLGEAIYNFALYQCGDALQTAIESELRPFVAGAASVAVTLVVPFESIRAAAQIAAIGSLTDWIVGIIESAADQDPFFSLLSLLVFCSVLLASVK